MIRKQPAEKPKAPARSKRKPKAAAKPKAPRRQKTKPEAVSVESAPADTPKKDGRDRSGECVLNGREDDVKQALRKAGGLKTVAAQMLKVSRGTLYKFLANNPDIEEELEDIDEEIKDLAEGKMLQLLRAGDPSTIRWYLEMKAKDRGYARRVENTGPNGGPMEMAQKPDLSQVTDEELDILIAAAKRRESTSQG